MSGVRSALRFPSLAGLRAGFIHQGGASLHRVPHHTQAPCRIAAARNLRCLKLIAMPGASPLSISVNLPTSTLLLDLCGPADRAWRAGLDALAEPLASACDGHNLVQRTNIAPPELLICLAPTLTTELAALLSAWGGAPPCAVLLLTPAL